MSHSTVLVIGEDPQTMLEPYDENTDVEPYRKYDDEEKPQDHWLFKTLVEEHGLSPEADWPAFVVAYNERYSEDDELFFDSDKGRTYQMSTYNPLSRWDWYQLGGRWTGFFSIKSGAYRRVRADQARKGDIDFDHMRSTAAIEGRALHVQASDVLAPLPPLVAWEKVREHLFPGDIEAARRFYHGQAGMAALRDAKLYFDDPVTYLCLDQPDPEAAYVERCRVKACLPFATLDDQGWHERGRMGWWGMVHDEKDTRTWQETAQAIIDGAPDDALFSIYDVHI